MKYQHNDFLFLSDQSEQLIGYVAAILHVPTTLEVPLSNR